MSKKAEQKKLEQEQKKALALKLEQDALKAQQEASSVIDTQDQDETEGEDIDQNETDLKDQDQEDSDQDEIKDEDQDQEKDQDQDQEKDEHYYRVKTPFLLSEVDGIREVAKIGQIISLDMINEGYLTDHFVERVSVESGEE